MTAILAVDLDRTTIYSANALSLPDGATADDPRLVCVEFYESAPLSFVTAQAAALLAHLTELGVVVPTTTRTRAQYGRVRLPGSMPRFAVCANGGHLLVDGATDEEWHALVRALLDSTSAPLGEVAERLADMRGEFVLRQRQAEDLFAYLVVDRDELPLSFVDDLAGWCAERGWRVSVQGRKVYVVPAELTKGAAVREVARRAGARTILAAGDSLLDIDLLEVADAGVTPGHGELADSGWTAPHITALSDVGVVAGQRVIEWLCRRAGLTPASLDSPVGSTSRAAREG